MQGGFDLPEPPGAVVAEIKVGYQGKTGVIHLLQKLSVSPADPKFQAFSILHLANRCPREWDSVNWCATHGIYFTSVAVVI